jgi:iron complex outermembrane receptor protein
MHQARVIRSFFAVLLALSTLIAPAEPVFGQAGTVNITGVVVDPAGTVVAGAEVTLAVGSLAVVTKTTTDTNGNFSVPAFSPGSYVLHVIRQPFVETLTEVTLTPDKPSTPLRIALSGPGGTGDKVPESAPAPVAGAGSVNTPSAYEVPADTQVISRAVIENQQALRPDDALRNASGFSSAFGVGFLRDRAIIRGFETAIFAQGGSYIDGFPQADTATSLANIEQVEVLKAGPGLLAGRTETGGFINYVSRRPQAQWAHSFQQQFGSYGSNRTTFDSTGPVRTDGSLLYRANLEYIDAESFRDSITWNRVFAAPSVVWKIKGRTEISIDGRYQHDKTPADHGIPASGASVADVPVSVFLGEPSDLSVTKVDQEMLALTHQVAERWTIKARGSRYSSRGDFNETAVEAFDETSGFADRFLYRAPNGTKAYQAGGEVAGRVTTGAITHTLLGGANHYRRNYYEHGVFVSATNTSNGLFPTRIDINNPVYGGFDRPAVLFNQPLLPFQTNDNWWGAFLQDQMTLARGLRVMAGGRVDRVRWDLSRSVDGLIDVQGLETEFSPQAGVLYQPVSLLSVFANHAMAFGGPNIAVTASGGTLPARRSRQSEGGVKSRWFENRLSANAAYFYVVQENIAQPLTFLPGGPSGMSGEAISRGVEVDIVGRPLDYVDVVASYTRTEGEYVEDENFAGNRLPNVARNTARLWVQSRLDWLGLGSLGLGGGVSAVGRRYGDSANSFEMPGYGRVDLGVSYGRQISRTTLTMRVNVSNLLDHQHFVAADWRPAFARTSTTPGAPRMVTVSVRAGF